MSATASIRKAALFLLSLPLLVGTVSGVRAQSALDGFDPSVSDFLGYVGTVAVQPDGKVLIGGGFTALAPNGGSPVTRNNIARLNPDGTLDTAFNPNINGRVFEILLQADGKIIVGGDFTTVGGLTRNYAARLDATTGLPDSFDPNANNPVYAISVQAGKILVGGIFTRIGGQIRNRIARLDPVTGLADSFDPNGNDEVNSIAAQADGKILVSGYFTSIGGQSRNRIARLDAGTGLADSFNPNANNTVFSIAVQSDGKILAGGTFSGTNSIGGQTRNYIARLDPVTGLADSFNPNASSNGFVRALLVLTDGKILVGGDFTSIGGQTRKAIARLDATTGLADSLNSGVSNSSNGVASVYGMATQTDGKILIGGTFDLVSGKVRKQIARLETDGRLDQTLKPSVAGGSVIATAVQPDGKILLAGSFTTIFSMGRNHMARLNTDGSLDSAFNPNASDIVNSVAVQADGKILAGGAFTTVGGQTRNYVARLDPTTGLPDSFDPNANGPLSAIAVQADGQILASGQFTIIGGQTRNHFARLDASTGLADSFDPNANADVYSIAIQTDGKILASGLFTNIGGQTRNRVARLDATNGLADLFNPGADNPVLSLALQSNGMILAGGEFTSIGGQTRNRIARLDPTSGLADSFNPNADNRVNSIAVQADGKILAGGLFTSMGAQTRNRIARLNATTGLADSFDPNANGEVHSLAMQTDGKILTSGQFDTIGGQPRSFLARLSNDAPALQDLSVTQSTITWVRGGSSPQFTRVTFEYSADAVNYSLLGNGTAAGSNWLLGGLSLPSGPLFYIRARGDYRSGHFNGSENLAELVRYGPADIMGPTPTATPIATPTTTPSPIPTPTGTPSPTPVPTATPGPSPCTVSIFTQNFDGVTPPALPTGWVSTFTNGPGNCQPSGTCGLGTNWATDATNPNTAPNSAFHDAPVCVTDSTLDSPSISIPGPVVPGCALNFRHSYNLENGFDGGVLEISISGGPFTDIVTAGGSPVGYNGLISTDFLNPLAGRSAWTGNSNGYINTSVSLPSAARGHDVVFRFRLATDCSVGGSGWWIDTITVTASQPCPTPSATPTVSPTATVPPTVCTLTGGFDNFATLVPSGWFIKNNSSPIGNTSWFQGNAATFTSQSGAPNSYIAVNYQSGSGMATISNWLLTPPMTLQNGAQLSFWTRTKDAPQFAERLQVRMSTNGTSTNLGTSGTSVGDFTTLLLDINPTYTLSGYPNVWTNFFVTLSGIASPVKGRLAFRYFVELGGPSGINSDYIGIDTVQYNCNGGLPTPTPTPTPTPPLINISGTISYCSNPSPGPVPNVTLTLTGSGSGSTLSDGSGNYQFSLASGGTYTLTPTKTALSPGSAAINTVDVVAVQRHFLILGTPLSGCRLTAADVNGDSNVNTVDVVAVQRFFLAMPTGIANVGKYKFSPASRSYPGVVSDQTGQNYDTLVFGDVASPFAE